MAIKKDSKILWSYHIWVPTETPSELSYPVTNSYDTYQLMNMPLGATKSVTAASSDADKILGAGLYYQWGRKDPLGRNAAASGGDLLTTSPLDLKTTANEVWFTTGKSGSLEDEYATYEGSTSDDPVILLGLLCSCAHTTKAPLYVSRFHAEKDAFMPNGWRFSEDGFYSKPESFQLESLGDKYDKSANLFTVKTGEHPALNY